jgi:hypothetical protein
VDPWGYNPGIAAEARWIWAADMIGTDEAFCRCKENQVPHGAHRSHSDHHSDGY